MSAQNKIKIGISRCLIGDKVRFSGDHKRDRYLMDTLADYVDFVALCPEVDIGMGVPRPAIHQEGDPANPQVIGVQDKSINVTKALNQYSRQTMPKLKSLCGFVVKSKSPTCGMERVRVHQTNGQSLRNGIGVFTKILMTSYPCLPVEEEGRLCDPILRENFITRVFAYHRWQQLIASNFSIKKLVEFHTHHKMLLRVHNEAGYQRLGRLVANNEKLALSTLKNNYIVEFMQTLATKSNRKKNANVLYHLLGYLKDELTVGDKKELIDYVEQYRLGQVPLIVPITLCKHYFRLHPNEYVLQQYYLNPHPAELMLRNHI